MIIAVGQRVIHDDGRRGTVSKSWGAGGFEVKWDNGQVWTYRPESNHVRPLKSKRGDG